MTKRLRLFAAWMLLILLVSACSTTQTPTSSTPILPPLPTPDVPPLETIDEAIRRWENSGNDSYYLEVEEKTSQRNDIYRVVVKDGQVRAAQQLTISPEGISEPMPFDLEQAQNQYTVDALLARLRRDATGGGAAPLNMRIIFDESNGFPNVVNAEALPSYTDQGSIQLNRQHSYSLIGDIKALLEDSARAGEEPVLFLTRSNGPEAWCDSLQVFSDGGSKYADDCRQESLPIDAPGNLMEQLAELQANFDVLDETRGTGGQIEHLVITGTGSEPPDAQAIQQSWALAERLHEILSYPLGAGVVLMYIENNDILGMDMQLQSVQPARISVRGELRGGAITRDASWLSYSDDQGLRAQDISTGTIESLLAQPGDGSYYVPRMYSSQNSLLVSKIPATDGGLFELSTIDPDSTKTELPIPAGIAGYGCDTGAAWSPDGSQIAVTGLGYGAPCNIHPGLTIIDLETSQANKIVERAVLDGIDTGSTILAGARNPAWSPDGEWISFSLDEDTTNPLNFPARLYVVHPDGRGLAPITTNTRGIADNPVWAPDGRLFFSLRNVSTEENGVYQYDIVSGEATLFLAGENLQPVSISPDGQFLVYADAGSR
jgi:hypothetical protein